MLSSLKDDAILLMLEGFSEKGPKISICSIGFGKRNTICLVKLWQFLYQRKYRARLDKFRKSISTLFSNSITDLIQKIFYGCQGPFEHSQGQLFLFYQEYLGWSQEPGV